jgi:bis(5'-nucleosyl)-tetraphosphatase (symmetrical)
VHAGLLPQWDVPEAQALAREVEQTLRTMGLREFCAALYGDEDAWTPQASGMQRVRVIVNAMTRMRVCSPEGRMQLRFKGEPKDAPAGFRPWFDVPTRRSKDCTVICGHWSALGLRLRPDLIAVDTGCLWGRSLTAVRLHDRTVFQVPGPASAATD